MYPIILVCSSAGLAKQLLHDVDCREHRWHCMHQTLKRNKLYKQETKLHIT